MDFCDAVKDTDWKTRMRYVIDVGDMKLGQKGDLLVTYGLGSCLGLMVYDPVTQVGGLLHAMLPASQINPEKAAQNPHMFVDTGVPSLFKELRAMGGQVPRMKVKAAGCGKIIGRNDIFKIGERNYTVLKRLLWKNNLLLAAEDVGGVASRTVFFDLSTGEVVISSNGKKWSL